MSGSAVHTGRTREVAAHQRIEQVASALNERRRCRSDLPRAISIHDHNREPELHPSGKGALWDVRATEKVGKNHVGSQQTGTDDVGIKSNRLVGTYRLLGGSEHRFSST